MSKLLVVDDEPSILDLVGRVFEKAGVQVITAGSGAAALEVVARDEPDMVLLDVLLPDQTGLQVFQRIQRIDPKLPVVLMTAGGTSDTAIEAMKLGALDYLMKPLDMSSVRAVVSQAFEIRHLMQDPVRLSDTVGSALITGDALVGRCRAIQTVYKAIGRVAAQNVTVLIRGESGTGKELVARALYHHSDRSRGPFMAVNCAAIPEALLESELFGHEKGSFTGADRQRVGKFEQCSGGTLFLDEVGDMSAPLQSKMLRVLQEQQFERVGGNKVIQTDVRIIAATNRNLEAMVADNHFRSDLYYRLNGFTIKLPPLRERPEDLTMLIDHFLARANHETGKDVLGVAPAALEVLQRYAWPGNVRELQSVIKQAVLQSAGRVLLAEFLPDDVRSRSAAAPVGSPAATPATESVAAAATEPTWAAPGTTDPGATDSIGTVSASTVSASTDPVDTDSVATLDATFDDFIDHRVTEGTETLYDESLERMERQLISRVLSHTGGSQVEAARVLGVTRTTLRTKIQKLGIKIDRTVRPG